MKDGDTLADYPRLKDKSNVFLTFRLNGGECNICYTDPSITLPCKHNYCVDCLIRQVKASTIAGERPSFKCYGDDDKCKSHWDLRILGKINNLSDADFNTICIEISKAKFVKILLLLYVLDVMDCVSESTHHDQEHDVVHVTVRVKKISVGNVKNRGKQVIIATVVMKLVKRLG